jgi:hypothetical protein
LVIGVRELCPDIIVGAFLFELKLRPAAHTEPRMSSTCVLAERRRRLVLTVITKS